MFMSSFFSNYSAPYCFDKIYVTGSDAAVESTFRSSLHLRPDGGYFGKWTPSARQSNVVRALLLWDRSFYEYTGVQTSVCKRAKPFRVVAPQRSKDYFALLFRTRKNFCPRALRSLFVYCVLPSVPPPLTCFI